MQIAKQVSDPVHGVIPLTAVEVAVMDTQVFQRLRRVRQLGLAHYVFPSADHSRLAHSLGVCHITGQILRALRDSGEQISEEHWQLYRLAALIHDIGHYPLSHCTEHAIKPYYQARQSDALLVQNNQDQNALPPLPEMDGLAAYKHEDVSRLLATNDKELSSVLRSNGIDPENVASIFLGQGLFDLDKLISSDLDADRIDYLLRSAQATGLPYGAIDLPYLLSQLTKDSDGRVCINKKGLRAADHFLLCRYFDYQQVVFHKSVVGLEQVAQMVIRELLDRQQLKLSKVDVRAAVESREWLALDDTYFMSLFADLINDSSTDELVRLKARAIIDRTPPKLVIGLDMVSDRGAGDALKNEILLAKSEFDKHAETLGITPGQCFEVERKFPLTSVGTSVPLGEKLPKLEEDIEKTIHVLRPSDGLSVPIMKRPASLMSVMANVQQQMFSLYVIPRPDQRDALDSLSKEIITKLPHLSWV